MSTEGRIATLSMWSTSRHRSARPCSTLLSPNMRRGTVAPLTNREAEPPRSIHGNSQRVYLVDVMSSDRDQVIVTRAAGREITRAEMIEILLAAGYRESSATGRMSSSHPLFQRTGPGWYRLVGEGDVP